jgi:prolyl oligopeptidase
MAACYPERDYPLESVTPVGGKLIAIFTKDVQSRIEVLDQDGKLLYPIQMPYQGTAMFVRGRIEDREGYFYFESFVKPSESYHYDVDTNQLSFYHRDPIPADLEDLVSKQIFFSSKDGTRVPLTVIHKDGIRLDGSNPLLLYGYGGFNIAMLPAFIRAGSHVGEGLHLCRSEPQRWQRIR